MPFWGLFGQEKCKNCNFWPLKWLPSPKVKVIWGHIAQTRCPLPQATSLPSFVGITKTDLQKSAKKWFFRTKRSKFDPHDLENRSRSCMSCLLPCIIWSNNYANLEWNPCNIQSQNGQKRLKSCQSLTLATWKIGDGQPSSFLHSGWSQAAIM